MNLFLHIYKALLFSLLLGLQVWYYAATATLLQYIMNFLFSSPPPQPPPSPNVFDSSQVRGQSLVLARWVAIFGQGIAILLAFYGLGFNFPLVPTMGFVVLSGLVNNYAYIHDHHRTMPQSRAFAYLVFDILQLSGLLYLTGGIDNPFSALLLAPVLVGTSLLSRLHASLLMAIGLVATAGLTFFFIPLEWPSHIALSLQAHRVLQFLALVITFLFAGSYAWRIAEESRSLQRASYAAKTALLKQKQLQALGAQAAAAVHELGSPLGTITIIAKEISNELGETHPQSEDIRLLIDQTKRCQSILKEFGATLRQDPTYLANALPVSDLLKNIASGFLKEKPYIRFLLDCSPDASAITLPQSAEIIHGLGVYIQNAIQFAKSTVRVTVKRGKQSGMVMTISDDGSGFAPHILSRLGEPYTSTRADSGKNMGLGIFIAQTLLEETGAKLTYNNVPSGGAKVKLEWTETDLQAMVPADKFHR